MSCSPIWFAIFIRKDLPLFDVSPVVGISVRKKEASPVERRFSLQPMPLIQFAMAVVFCWVIFYLLAQLIVGVPDKFHEGTLWE